MISDSTHATSHGSALITIRQACDQLQIGRTLLYGLCQAGAIRSVKVGRRGVRIPAAEIDRFIRERLECE